MIAMAWGHISWNWSFWFSIWQFSSWSTPSINWQVDRKKKTKQKIKAETKITPSRTSSFYTYSRQVTSVFSVEYACIPKCCTVSLKKGTNLPQDFSYRTEARKWITGSHNYESIRKSDEIQLKCRSLFYFGRSVEAVTSFVGAPLQYPISADFWRFLEHPDTRELTMQVPHADIKKIIIKKLQSWWS